MALVNVLLVRWQGGWIETENAVSIAAHGRRESFITVGAITVREEADRIGDGLLALIGDPRVATTLGIEPSGAGDEPYVDFDLGDTITAPDENGGTSVQRVVSMTVAEDDNGEVTYANELKATALIQEENFNRWLKLLLSGALRGNARNVSPVPPATQTFG